MALGIKRTRNVGPTTVTVFTDSQAAITKILDPKARVGGDAVRDLVYQNAHVIKNAGHTVALRWVAGHPEIPGNEKADAAKDIAQKGGKETDYLSSLTYINAELQKATSAELLAWHQSKSQEREATAQGSMSHQQKVA